MANWLVHTAGEKEKSVFRPKNFDGFGYCPDCCSGKLPFKGGFRTIQYRTEKALYCGECKHILGVICT